MTTNDSLNVQPCEGYEKKAPEDFTNFTFIRIIFGSLYLTIFCLGVLGNGFVIAALVKFKNLRTVRNLFILNLSISDTLVCFLSLPITAYQILFKNWIFGEPLCYVIPVMQGASIIISTFTLTCIAVDRFVLIIFPRRPPINKHTALTMIIIVWALGIGASTPTGVNSRLVPGTRYYIDPPLCGQYCEEIGWDRWNPTYRQAYGTGLLVVQFALPLTIITICYAAMFWKLKAREKSTLISNENYNNNRPLVQKTADQSERQREKEKRRQRTNLMLVLMVCLFGITWFPQVTLNILKDINAVPKFFADQAFFYSLIAHCIAMTSTFCNVFLYGYMNEAFRTAFASMLFCGRANGGPLLSSKFRTDPAACANQGPTSTR